jgi:putative peptidoglycan lipid II flippase
MLPATVNRRILKASAVIAAAAVIVKLSGVAKEVVVAWRFGASDDLDAFNVALVLPFSLIHIAATPFQTAFIPAYVQVQQRDGAAAAQQLLSSSLVWLLGIFVAAIVGLLLCGPFYLPLLASGFSLEKLRLTFQLLCLIAPVILLVGTSFLLAGVLNVNAQFAISSATPLITTGLTVLLLVFAQRLGVFALALAMTGGAILELTVLGWVLSRQGISVRPRWHAMSAPLWRIIQNSFSLLLGNLLMAGTQVIGIAVAARMATGSVAALSYASKITLLSAGLIASSFGTATVAFFAKMSAQENWRELKSTLHHFLGIAFLITCPITILIMLFAAPLTRLLFQRGAFGVTEVALVSDLIFYFALQIPFYVTNVLIAKIFLALQTPQIILFGSAVNLVVYTAIAYFLSIKLGLTGIAIATSITYLCSFLVLYTFADRKLKRLLAQ